MSTVTKFSVVLLDKNACEISERSADSLKQAKAELKYLLSADYAKAVGTKLALNILILK